MKVMGRAWRRFRQLPSGVQAGAVLGLLAAYTVALVLLLGGGDGDDGSAEPERPLSPLEREVKRNIEQGRLRQSDETDVREFRAPRAASVRCEANSCKAAYSIAVPGRGRILIQQVDIVRRVFGETEVERIELQVVRGEPRGPLASPKSEEETPVGVPLFVTVCDESRAREAPDWSSFRSAQVGYTEICEVRNVFRGGPGGGQGAPGGGGGE
jgi:hypothetical protein